MEEEQAAKVSGLRSSCGFRNAIIGVKRPAASVISQQLKSQFFLFVIGGAIFNGILLQGHTIHLVKSCGLIAVTV